MKDWFDKLQQREQHFILAGGAVLGLFFLYILLWLPFSNSIEESHKRVVSQEKILQWMKFSAEEIRLQGSAHASIPVGNRSLLTLISQTSKSAGLGENMKRVEEDGRNKARVWLEQADFGKLVLWLGSLQNSHAINATQVTVDRQAANGLVNVRLLLEK